MCDQEIKATKSPGRPCKLSQLGMRVYEIIMAHTIEVTIGGKKYLRATKSDAELAGIIWQEALAVTGATDADLRANLVAELPDTEKPAAIWVRRRRQFLGILPVPRGGKRPGAGRPKGSKTKKVIVPKKLTCSREDLVMWSISAYKLDKDKGVYKYNKDSGAKPDDLPKYFYPSLRPGKNCKRGKRGGKHDLPTGQ